MKTKINSFQGKRLAIAQKKHAAGFSMLELLLVAAIGISLYGVTMAVKVQDAEQEGARRVGVEMGQYNNAVREYLSDLPGLLAANPMSLPVTYSGTAWLKESACGGSAAKAYLPCGFADSPRAFGIGDYTTTLTGDGDGSFTAVTKIGPIDINGTLRGDLAGQVARSADKTHPQTGDPVWSPTFAGFVANDNPEAGTGFTLDDLGSVYARASTHPNPDVWLRVDGTNTMLANLHMNDHDVVEGRDVYGKKFIDKDDNGLYLEPAGTSRLNALDVYGADQAPGGSGGDEGRLESDVNLAHNALRSPLFEDLDDVGFYLDPHQTSRVSDVEVAGPDGVVNYLTGAPVGAWGRVSADEARASQRVIAARYTDSGYWADLDKISRIHSLDVVGKDGLLTMGSGAFDVNPNTTGLFQTDWLMAWQGVGSTVLYDLDDPAGMSGTNPTGAPFKYFLNLEGGSVMHALSIDSTAQGGDFIAPQLVDWDDTRFFADPSGTSLVRHVHAVGSDALLAPTGNQGLWGWARTQNLIAPNQLIAPVVYDRDNTFYRLDMAADSFFNSLTLDNYGQGGRLYAPILIDSDDAGYYLDPDKMSRVGRMESLGAARFNGAATLKGTTNFLGNTYFHAPATFSKGVTFYDGATFNRNATFDRSVSVAKTLTGDKGYFNKLYVNGTDVKQKLAQHDARLNTNDAALNNLDGGMNTLQNRINYLNTTPGPAGPPGAQGPAGPPGPRGPAGQVIVINIGCGHCTLSGKVCICGGQR